METKAQKLGITKFPFIERHPVNNYIIYREESDGMWEAWTRDENGKCIAYAHSNGIRQVGKKKVGTLEYTEFLNSLNNQSQNKMDNQETKNQAGEVAIALMEESANALQSDGKIKPSEVQTKQGNVNAQLMFPIDVGGILYEATRQYIEKESGLLQHVNNRITEEAMKLRPNQINIGEKKMVEIKGRLHKDFKDAADLILMERNLYLAGPAGTGKTTLASQIAESLNLPFGHLSCTSGMSEAHILGRMVANGDYISSQFVEIYENGGVFLFDEVDAADSNTLLIINSALANGHMSVPNRKDNPIAKRHKDFYCVCAANTFGKGSIEYAGRNVLDDAFLDRFAGSRMLITYDKELEREICGTYVELFNKISAIRANVEKYKIRRVVSTRAFVSGARAMANGKSVANYIDRFTTGWSEEEKKKALETK